MIGFLRTSIQRHVIPWLTPRWQSVAGAWNEFWFRPTDPFLLCVIRLLTGWMVFYNLCVWSLDLEAFFSSDGLQPLSSIRRLQESQLVFSFWMWTSDSLLWPVHCVCLLITAMFCAGMFTRVTSILSFLITISYSQRVPVANFGLDQLMGIMCLYLAMAPCGERLSFDAWWRSRRARGQGTLRTAGRFASATMVSRLMQLHLCSIYFWAGHAKLKGPTWWTGEAMWNVLANQEYQTCDLTWLAWFPWIPYFIAHLTILWEGFFPVLIWNRTLRPLMLWLGFGMHVGIGAFLGMWTFGLIMTFGYLTFLDAEYWRARYDSWRSRGLRKRQGYESGDDGRSGADPVDVCAPVGRTTGQSAVTDRVFNQPQVIAIAAVQADQQSLTKYFGDHGYQCRAESRLSEGLRGMDASGSSALIVHCGRLQTSDVAGLVSQMEQRPEVITILLLPERLAPLGASGLPKHLRWLPLSASLRQIRCELEAMLRCRAGSRPCGDPVEGDARSIAGQGAPSAPAADPVSVTTIRRSTPSTGTVCDIPDGH